jgi:beta-phosphoglucomutase
MDGVLVDSAPAHFESWQRLAREEGITITRKQFEASFGRQNRDIIPMFLGPVSPDRLAAIAQRKEAIYRDLVRVRVPAVDGAVDLVSALAAQKIPLAIGSAGPRVNIDLVLEGMRVADYFETIVSGEDATRGKPDPQVFQLACERLRLPPGRCVVIEDATAGVEAARAAGTKVAAVMMHHPAESLRNAGADIVVERLKDLTVVRLKDLVSQ